ncbi:MAG: DUF4317 domain-containing protein [Oscillospiraceae bacterium]|nr:DUF4317 domain-containing protein [Oscillospiraceae bacterium]
MNTKEIGEIRRRVRRDRSNMTAIYGCYVNDNKEIISQFRKSTATMSENEAEKYFGLLKRALSGSLGKNLIDITFQTAQVASSPEHGLLMDLRKTELKDETFLDAFYKKIIENLSLDTAYLILLGCDNYDVPFKSKDGDTQADNSGESYRYLLCAICPVKQTKATLHYVPEEKEFHDGGITNVVAAPELGFLFPAFDDRATNIYNALYYTHSTKESHEDFVDAVFHTQVPKPAEEQKQSFQALLTTALDDACSMDVVQTVHEQLCQRIELHKESKVPEPLLVTKEDVKEALTTCGVAEDKLAKFSVEYDEVFGFEAELHPKNIINDKRFEIKTPDVAIKVAPDRTDLIETRVIGGVKYILICAEEDVEVNGVSIHIGEKEPAAV